MLEDAAARAAAGKSLGKADELALSFHRRIAEMILENCIRIREESGVSDVALTGGVFQNKLLMEETLALLRTSGMRPYYNISVSPNDGGIALGQAFAAMNG